jgi:hypothetical protein
VGRGGEVLTAPRAAYDAACGAGYAELRAAVSAGPFVDLARLG